jgi:hypothetical protein
LSKTPIVLQPGSHVAIGDAKVARVIWHEAPASGGTAVAKDANGTVIASIFYAGRNKGPEPQPVNFSPATSAVGGVFGFAPGGWLQIHVQGASESGH